MLSKAEQKKVIGQTLGRITKHLGAYNISRKYGASRLTDRMELLLLMSNGLVSRSDRIEISKAADLLFKINEIGTKIRDVKALVDKGKITRDAGESSLAEIRDQACKLIPKTEIDQVILALGRISTNFKCGTTLPTK